MRGTRANNTLLHVVQEHLSTLYLRPYANTYDESSSLELGTTASRATQQHDKFVAYGFQPTYRRREEFYLLHLILVQQHSSAFMRDIAFITFEGQEATCPNPHVFRLAKGEKQPSLPWVPATHVGVTPGDI